MKQLHGIHIKDTETFNKTVKRLKKRFRTIEKDCQTFINSITTDKDLGIHLGNGVFKVRIKNSDKQSGKSGGYRIISYLKLIDNAL